MLSNMLRDQVVIVTVRSITGAIKLVSQRGYRWIIIYGYL